MTLTPPGHFVTTGSLWPSGTGALTVQLPDGWTLQGLSVPDLGPAANCTFDATQGSCAFPVEPGTTYDYTLVVSGPADDHASQLQLGFSETVNGDVYAVQKSVPVNPVDPDDPNTP